MGHTWRRLGDVARPTPAVARVAQPRWRRRVAATAMALAACVALYFFPALQMRVLADHMTGVAELREVVLEDGSVVHLDAGSAIAVKYAAAGRDVALLSGQAFFEVKLAAGPAIPGAVGRRDGDGDRDGLQRALVGAGRVRRRAVRHGRGVWRQGAPTVLTRGQRAVVERASGGIVQGEVAPAEVASWRRRRLVVHDATLDDVVEELGASPRRADPAARPHARTPASDRRLRPHAPDRGADGAGRVAERQADRDHAVPAGYLGKVIFAGGAPLSGAP